MRSFFAFLAVHSARNVEKVQEMWTLIFMQYGRIHITKYLAKMQNFCHGWLVHGGEECLINLVSKSMQIETTDSNLVGIMSRLIGSLNM